MLKKETCKLVNFGNWNYIDSDKEGRKERERERDKGRERKRVVAMASVQLQRQGSSPKQQDSPRSPEAELGMKVEDMWDVLEPQLSPSEKLNACFESIPVEAFPPAPSSQGIYCLHMYIFALLLYQ